MSTNKNSVKPKEGSYIIRAYMRHNIHWQDPDLNTMNLFILGPSSETGLRLSPESLKSMISQTPAGPEVMYLAFSI